MVSSSVGKELPPPEREADIPHALGKIDRALGDLHTKIDSLTLKLETVLRPDLANTKEPLADIQQVVSAPLAKELVDISGSLREAWEKLDNLYQRIEL